MVFISLFIDIILIKNNESAYFYEWLNVILIPIPIKREFFIFSLKNL